MKMRRWGIGILILGFLCGVSMPSACCRAAEVNNPIIASNLDSGKHHLTSQQLEDYTNKSGPDPAASYRIYQYYAFDQRNEYMANRWLDLAASGGSSEARQLISEHLKRIEAEAEKGNARIQNQLGTMYCEGKSGVNRDLVEAEKWYLKAYKNGNIQAMTNLGIIYKNRSYRNYNIKDAVKWHTLAASKDDVESEIMLGTIYRTGDGVKKDYQESEKWYRRAAEHGSPFAQHNIGLLYYGGNLGSVNYPEALKWFRMAANQGNFASMQLLSHMYRTGKGVSKNEAEADRWGLAKQQQHLPPDDTVYCVLPIH